MRRPDWSLLDHERLHDAYTFAAAAPFYIAAGIPVFPVREDKKPYTPHGFLDATTDPDQIATWARKWPYAGIGMPTGEASDTWVADIDPRHGASYDQLAARFGLPDTLTSETGGGGNHLVFRHPGFPVANDAAGKKLGEGYDIRGDGGYIVVPNSPHPSGGRYQWLVCTEPAPAPDAMLALLRPEDRPQADATADATATARPHRADPAEMRDVGRYWLDRYLPDAREGNRNNAGFLLALQLRDEGLSLHEAEQYMTAYAACVPGKDYSQREALRTLKSVYSRPRRERAISQTPRSYAQTRSQAHQTGGSARQGEDAYTGGPDTSDGATPAASDEGPRIYRQTEMGNTDRLYDAYGANVRHCKELGFVTWNGKHWEADSEQRVRGWAEKVIRGLYDEAADLTRQAAQASDEETAKALAARAASLLDWARKSSTHKMVTAMIGLIKPHIDVSPAIFDAHLMLYNCANGTLDLTTGILRPHRREDYLMQCSSTAYSPGEDAPTFKRFVREIMLADDPSRPDHAQRLELVRYLQRVFGYALTGDIDEQEWYLLVGKDGDNGKTTLIEDAICNVLAGYSYTLEPEAITVTGRPRDAAAPSPERADLKGKRFVRVTETEKGARLAAALIKKLCGTDEITGRHLHKEIIRFRATHKLFIYTNHKPHVRETGHAFWRRVRYIPFDFTLKDHPERKDKQLGKKLRAEASGILNWMIEGCLAWQREGLNPPKIVLDATEEYQAESDTLRPFLEDCCVIHPDAKVSASALYEAYKAWCASAGEHPQRQRDFGSALTERGFTSRRGFGKSGAHGWYGIGLCDPSTPPPADPDPDPDPRTNPPTDPTDPTYPHFGIFPEVHLHESKMPQVGSVGSEGSVDDADLWTAEVVNPVKAAPVDSGATPQATREANPMPRRTFEERVQAYMRNGMREADAIRRVIAENDARRRAPMQRDQGA